MIAWLDIDGGATGFSRSIYSDPAALAHTAGARSHRWLADIGPIQRTLSIPGIAAAPVANLSATLTNADGAVTAAFSDRPPLRHAAAIKTPDGTLFAGTVTRLSLGESASLDIEAGLDRPLSDALPLRRSTVWGGYREVATLPWCYGSVTLAPIQYSDDRRVWFLADHPIEGVDAVWRDNVTTPAWAHSNATDSTGRACAFLELAEPLAEGETLAVQIRGRMHPDTGRLLTTPAEILHDVLANLAGAPVSWADLDAFRTETAEITFGGILSDESATIRSTIDALLMSAGAAWSAGMPGIAFLWPPAEDTAAPVLPVQPLTVDGIDARTDHTGLRTRLRVLFDYDYAAGRHRRAIQLDAPAQIAEYGVLEQEWDARWLRSPREAELLGRRMLEWLALPRWRVTWGTDAAGVAVGAWANLAHPQCPVAGRHRLIDATLDLSGPSLTCAVEAPVGVVPAITTTQIATAFDPLIPPGVTVDVGANEIIFTVRGDDGRVIPGAIVTLNGTTTRIADAGGRVSFQVARGRHHLRIEAPGRAASEVEVTV